MKYAISNIALPAFNHETTFPALAEMGYQGVEVAPSRVWHETSKGPSKSEVDTYRATIEASGLEVVGLHSLLFDQPHLSMFAEPTVRNETLEFLVRLSAVCRDLGGKTLIWGGGRRRGDLPHAQAFPSAVAFLQRLCERTREHGTVFCFEPLGPNNTDFVHGVHEAKEITQAVGYKNMLLQIDAKALVDNNEVNNETFSAAKHMLCHVHANEPDLGVLGSSGSVDHGKIGGLLAEIGYNGFVSAEQRMLSDVDYLKDAKTSYSQLVKNYHGQ